jgi:hypothetical protein
VVRAGGRGNEKEHIHGRIDQASLDTSVRAVENMWRLGHEEKRFHKVVKLLARKHLPPGVSPRETLSTARAL